MISITIDNIFILWAALFVTAWVIILGISRFNNKENSGKFALEKTKNFVRAEKFKKEHQISLTGRDY